MKRTIRIIFSTALFLLIGLGALNNKVSAESYIETGHYDIDILDSGDVSVEESWVIYFDDDKDYSRYFRSYYNTGYHEITDWEAELDGAPMEMLPAPSDNRPDATFAVDQDSEHTTIHLYHNTRDASRSFTIRYTVRNAVKLYDDIGDFVWDLSGANEFSDIREGLTASVTIPEGIDPEDFRIWAHGPPDGVFEQESDTLALLSIDSLQADEIVDIRVCLPSWVFSGGYPMDGEGLPDILSHEANLAESANATRREQEAQAEAERIYREKHPVRAVVSDIPQAILDGFDSSFGILLGVYLFLSLIVVILRPLIFVGAIERDEGLKQTRKLMGDDYVTPDYYRGLPDETPPAVLAKIMAKTPVKGTSAKHGFSAAMLDLALRGVITIGDEDGDGDIDLSINRDAAVKWDYEEPLMEILRLSATDNQTSIRKMNAYAKNNGDKIAGLRSKFDSCVEKEVQASGYIEKFAYQALTVKNVCKFAFQSIKWALPFALLSLGQASYALMAAMALAIMLSAIGIYTLFFVAVSFFTRTGERFTVDGFRKIELWTAFRHFLEDFTTFEEKDLPEIHLWQRYMVYATALGVSATIIRQLVLLHPVNLNGQDDDWAARSLFASDAVDKAISSVSASTYSAKDTSSDSSSSGSGGGFSSSDGSSGSGSSGSGID